MSRRGLKMPARQPDNRSTGSGEIVPKPVGVSERYGRLPPAGNEKWVIRCVRALETRSSEVRKRFFGTAPAQGYAGPKRQNHGDESPIRFRLSE